MSFFLRKINTCIIFTQHFWPVPQRTKLVGSLPVLLLHNSSWMEANGGLLLWWFPAGHQSSVIYGRCKVIHNFLSTLSHQARAVDLHKNGNTYSPGSWRRQKLRTSLLSYLHLQVFHCVSPVTFRWPKRHERCWAQFLPVRYHQFERHTVQWAYKWSGFGLHEQRTFSSLLSKREICRQNCTHCTFARNRVQTRNS